MEGCSTSEPTLAPSPTFVPPCTAPKPAKIVNPKPVLPQAPSNAPFPQTNNADVTSLSHTANWAPPPIAAPNTTMRKYYVSL